jgi:hypothetical protein
MLEVEPEFLTMTLQMPPGSGAKHRNIDLDRMVEVA